MRIGQIDALRGVAVLLVAGSHLTCFRLWHDFGWTGVDLFFVLSGFLISGLLFREYQQTSGLRISRFMLRRALKIYPAYYFLLAVTVAWYAVAGPSVRWPELWPDLIFVQNYQQGTWGHFWSLGVEEHFYLFLPLCLWLLTRRGWLHRLPLVAIAVMIVCPVLRAVAWSHGELPLKASHYRFDSLFFGVLLSYIREFHAAALERAVRRHAPAILGVSVVCLLPAVFFAQDSPLVCVPGFTFLYLGYGGILLLSLYAMEAAGPAVALLRRIGVYSYSIYLFHLPLACIFQDVFYNGRHWSPLATFLTYLLASSATGSLLSKAIELPVLQLRDRLFPEKPGSSARSFTRRREAAPPASSLEPA